MSNAVYGYCPQCGKKGVQRERRPYGNDICENGHTYPSDKALTTTQEIKQPTKFADLIKQSGEATEAPTILNQWVSKEETKQLAAQAHSVYETILKKNGFPVRTFDDLSSVEMSGWVEAADRIIELLHMSKTQGV